MLTSLFSCLALLGVQPSLAIVHVKRDTNVSFQVPSSTPSGAAGPVSPSFVAWGFELDSAVVFATGNYSDAAPTNVFTTNLINSVMQRTGGDPLIRVGGTSGDFAAYSADQQEPIIPPSRCTANNTIGDNFWIAMQKFPSNSKIIVQVPLANQNASTSVAWAQGAVNTLGWDKIYSLEIGNEPDLYGSNINCVTNAPLGPPTWYGKQTNQSYANIWSARAATVASAIGKSGQIFQAFDTKTYPTNPPLDKSILNPPIVFGDGINKGNNIKTIAHHMHFANGAQATYAESLMNHTFIDYVLSQFDEAIAFGQSQSPSIDFVLSETGSSLYAPTGIANSFGATLWGVDFQLDAMTHGVAFVNMEQGDYHPYNMWVPPQQPESVVVQAQYYSQPFVADFIGTESIKAALIGVQGNTIAYGAWSNGNLVRIALINLDIWSQGNGTRPIDTVTFDGVTASSATLAHLKTPEGAGGKAEDGDNQITYNGYQWSKANGNGVQQMVGADGGNTTAVVSEKLTVLIQASEAILIHLS